MLTRRHLMQGSLAFLGAGSVHHAALADVSRRPFAEAEPWARKLIDAAASQVGITNSYDPSYRKLTFPMGDIPRQSGVCTDVIIRAYRDAFDLDLQALVNSDMKSAFGEYPPLWGLKTTDRNIDHRRVPNLERFFERRNADLPITDNPADYAPGDIVSQRLPGNLPHIGIVSDETSADGSRPLLIHNIGRGAQIEDRIFEFTINGHYRVKPEALG